MAKDIRDARALIGSSIYTDDNRYIGTVEEVGQPDLSLLSVESGVGVMRDTPVPIMEALKLTLKVSGEGEALIKNFSKQVTESQKYFIRNDTTTARHDSIDVTAEGKVKVLKMPIPKAGEKMETEIEINLDVYIYMVNGTKHVEIDALNHIMSIGGVDLLAETRANL